MLKHSVVRLTISVCLDLLFPATDQESQTFEHEPRFTEDLHDVYDIN
jgi:hypothetical protein